MKSFLTGIYNLWYFRKVVWNFRWWDYVHNLELLQKSFEYSSDYHKLHGNGENSQTISTELSLATKMLERVRSHSFIDEAQNELNYTLAPVYIVGNRLQHGEGYDKIKEDQVWSRAKELEIDNWNKLWKLLKSKMQTWWD